MAGNLLERTASLDGPGGGKEKQLSADSHPASGRETSDQHYYKGEHVQGHAKTG